MFWKHTELSLCQGWDHQCCGKSKILGRPTDHPWLMVGWSVSVLGGPSIIYWDHEMIKSIKELVKIRQSVFTLYSDTSTNRHTNGFLQDCSISSALAMEILQSCVKPWIWYQCIRLRSCLSTFLLKIFLQTIKNSLVAKRTIHGRTLGRLLDSWVAIGDRATVFQKHWIISEN